MLACLPHANTAHRLPTLAAACCATSSHSSLVAPSHSQALEQKFLRVCFACKRSKPAATTPSPVLPTRLALHPSLAPWHPACLPAGKEYSKADSRYASRDSFIISMEAVTAFLWGPLCPLLVWGIFTAKPWRYALMLVVSVGQIYGDVLYSGTCYLDGGVLGGALGRGRRRNGCYHERWCRGAGVRTHGCQH